MRIGIDARELTGNATGAGRYLGGLLAEWDRASYARRHEFVLYTSGTIGFPIDTRRFPTRLVTGGSGTVWEQINLPRVALKDHLDAFFAPAYTAPFLGRTPVVVAIHDVSFFAHPEWFAVREGLRRRWLTRRAARLASTIITISEFSRAEIIERLHVSETRIKVIPPGISPAQGPGVRAGGSGVRAQGQLEPRVLFVGSIFQRRNIPDLLRAFAIVASGRPDARLDIVGDNRTCPRENIARLIERSGAADQVRWHQYVDDGALEELYGSARAFVFLSEYEGLGLTPLEALARGVPSVLLDSPVARETCGNAAFYVEKGAISDTAAIIRTALFDEAARTRVLAAAPAALAKYDWARAARETLAAIESAAIESE
ncbi:MAG TPA: glycosyltransferase family 1 protein [Vicinamibacterales bacterium]|nr:glycosyltransferase family 1 protein [Vicinamibacterales bacterium]